MSVDQYNSMAARAAAVLQANDTGTSIKAAPVLYPHQGSWDTAFVSIGLAHLSLDRAVQEMRRLFRGQWKNGMLPHIVYSAGVSKGTYPPGADHWDVANTSSDAPDGVATSGIVQPPVHAITIRLICDRANPQQARAIAMEFYQPLLEWHRYLISVRDPEVSGLVTIVHPWESGMGNSPRWDRAMARVRVPEGEFPPFDRRNLAHVADHGQYPADEDYDRLLWIVEVLKRGGYRVDELYDELPFRVKDTFMSAMLVAANEALIRIAALAGGDFDDLTIIESWIDRGRRGLAEQWNPDEGLCCDRDVINNSSIKTRTIATFAPLVAGDVTVETREALIRIWGSQAFTGHPDLRWALPPSTSPYEPSFVPDRFWRGSVWPVMNWLLWWAWRRIGEEGIAAALRESALDQIATAGFAACMEPFTGEALGPANRPWTAAVALDWLAVS